MTERHAARARQDRALHDAVVDEGVVHDHIIATEQMADDGNVGRVSADQHDAVLGAVDPRQRLLQFAVDRALSRYHAAGRDRGAVAVDRGFRRARDARIAVQADIVVGREIDVGAVADQRLGAGNTLMHAKKRVGDIEVFRRLLDQANFPIGFELGDIEAVRPAIIGGGLTPPRQRRPGSTGSHRGQLLQEAHLRLRGQSEEIPAGRHSPHSAAADLNSVSSSAAAASATDATRPSSAAS